MVWLLPLLWMVVLNLGEPPLPQRSVQAVVIQIGLLIVLAVIGGAFDVCRAIRRER